MDEAERERRRRLIVEARETVKRVAAIEVDHLAVAMSRSVESVMDRDRRELAARDAEWAQRREAERQHQAETVPAAEVGEALEACAAAIDAMDRENVALRERVDELTRRLDAVERRPVDDLGAVDRGLAKIDRLCGKLQQTLQVSERRALDDGPLPPHLSQH
jgi:small-conductance mechanosensitive channel